MESTIRPKLWSLSYINVCLANFLMSCSFYLLMPSIPLYITEQLGVAQTKTGIVLASYAIAVLIVRPFSGYLVDLFSRKTILLISFICFVAIFFGYFYAVTIGLIVLVRFFHGITWGLSSVSANTLAIDIIPSERRTEGIGYFGTFMNVSMAIGSFIAIDIYHRYSFTVLLYCAVFMGVLGIIAVSFIKAPDRPPVEGNKLSLDRFFLLPAWPIFLNQLLPSFAWGTIGSFAAQYGKEINIPNAGTFFLCWAGGIVLSRIFSGRMVDKGYIHLVNTLAMAIVALSFLAFATIHTSEAFYASGLFIGVGFGMMFPALQTLYINMARHNQRGTANSTYMVGFDLGLALGMLVGGYITGMYSFSSLYLLASGLCFFSIFIYQMVSKRLYDAKRLR